MSLEIKCDNCRKFLTKPGAVLITPPAANDIHSVNKYHLCDHCVNMVLDWMRGKGVL